MGVAIRGSVVIGSLAGIGVVILVIGKAATGPEGWKTFRKRVLPVVLGLAALAVALYALEEGVS